MMLWLLGKATELTDQHRQYQANSIKDRVVLSTIFLGLQILNDARVLLTPEDICLAGKTLHAIVKACAEEE